MMEGWEGGGIKKENDWKLHSYKGTTLCYDVLCESVNSDMELSSSLISTRKMYTRGVLILCVVSDGDSTYYIS